MATTAQFSGFTFAGVRRALSDLGWLDETLAQVQPETRKVLDHPETLKFHDGACLDDVVETLRRTRGPDAPEALMRTATAKSLEGIVAPLARIYLTFSRGDPGVLLERFGSLTQALSRNIAAGWTRESEHGGILSLTYPHVPPPAVDLGWRGALHHLLDFAKRAGTVEVLERAGGGHTLRLRVEWAPATR
jgi:hypothetical protein